MKDVESIRSAFLFGLSIGVAVALLYAPQSGKKTRKWISDTAEDGLETLQGAGRRSMRQLKHTAGKGEEALADIVRGGKEALESVAEKLG